MSHPFSAQEEATYRDLFSLFDFEADGSINSVELGSLLRSLNKNVTEASIKDMINNVDVDGNGSIDYREFLQMMLYPMPDVDRADAIANALKHFDTNNDGLISISDIVHILTTVGEPLNEVEVEEFIKIANVDGNNNFQYPELAQSLVSNLS